MGQGNMSEMQVCISVDAFKHLALEKTLKFQTVVEKKKSELGVYTTCTYTCMCTV